MKSLAKLARNGYLVSARKSCTGHHRSNRRYAFAASAARKPLEAARTVAGGHGEARDHRIHDGAMVSDRGSGRGGNSRRLVFGTRPHPGSMTGRRPIFRWSRASHVTTGYRTKRPRRLKHAAEPAAVQPASVYGDMVDRWPETWWTHSAAGPPAAPWQVVCTRSAEPTALRALATRTNFEIASAMRP